jgi:biopolymer transport protein ExbD
MSAQNSDVAEPNLTPLLDMVFQLITFFMLVINFKGASMDLSLKLPVLGSARPLEWKGRLEPLMVNINRQGLVHVYGQTVEIEPYIKREAKVLRSQLKAQGTTVGDEGFPVPVVVRADENVTFELLNRVIRVCQEEGYRQFSLSAMNRAEGGGT